MPTPASAFGLRGLAVVAAILLPSRRQDPMSKLSDTQLILLSSASRREDGLVALPKELQGAAAAKAVKPLLAQALLREFSATVDMPVWRRDQDGAHALA